jgi:hypothetical protein
VTTPKAKEITKGTTEGPALERLRRTSFLSKLVEFYHCLSPEGYIKYGIYVTVVAFLMTLLRNKSKNTIVPTYFLIHPPLVYPAS